jgi:hypothetical protein
MKKTLNYNEIDCDKHFYLSNTSPSGIRWLISPRNGMDEGSVAGTKHYEPDGRKSSWQVMLKGQIYMVSRVIWVLAHKYLPSDLVVDHLNGDPFDNSVANLSIKTQTENLRNLKKYKTNTSGITGVGYRVMRSHCGSKTYEYWYAIWENLQGRQRSKQFSCNKYGHEIAKSLAIEQRNLQISLLNVAGASYTGRHGTE